MAAPLIAGTVLRIALRVAIAYGVLAGALCAAREWGNKNRREDELDARVREADAKCHAASAAAEEIARADIQLYEVGNRYLQTRPEDCDSDRAYLTRIYTGLYLIGRSGHRVPSQLLDHWAHILATVHQIVRPSYDKPIVTYYKSMGGVRSGSLAVLLDKRCKEARDLGVDLRYIGFALGEEYPNLNTDGPYSDVPTQFLFLEDA